MASRRFWALLSALFNVCCSGCASTTRLPQPTGEPLPIAPGKFPHDAFDRVLSKHVDESGRVDYKSLRADRNELERYIVALSKTSPRQDPGMFPTREHKLAYWINAYNASVLYAVTERPQMKSVDDEKISFFGLTKYRLGNEAVSLYALENDIVRKEFNEPRIHFALNCASGGCPELPNEAFMPDRLEEQLAREARAFCADEKKVRVRDDKVDVSQIFDWYADDFKAGGGPIAFCRAWGRDDLPENAKVEFIPYDWSLNAQPGRALYE
jgi:hypothetical protein